jgi:hypothetical protein
MRKDASECVALFQNGLSKAVLGTCFLVATLAAAQGPILRSTTDYPSSGVSLGYGWNATYGQKTVGACVDFIENDDTGQDATASITNVSDNYSLMSSLQVSAEAQLKANRNQVDNAGRPGEVS